MAFTLMIISKKLKIEENIFNLALLNKCIKKLRLFKITITVNIFLIKIYLFFILNNLK